MELSNFEKLIKDNFLIDRQLPIFADGPSKKLFKEISYEIWTIKTFMREVKSKTFPNRDISMDTYILIGERFRRHLNSSLKDTEVFIPASHMMNNILEYLYIIY